MPVRILRAPPNIPFRDITAGSNGYLASTGYDLATGLGAWSYTPGAPTGLIASSVAGGVALSWSAPSGAPPSGYTIWRGTSSGQETTAVGTVSAPATAFTDASTTAGSTYYYEVQAQRRRRSGPVLQPGVGQGWLGDLLHRDLQRQRRVRDDGRGDRQRPDGAEPQRLYPLRLLPSRAGTPPPPARAAPTATGPPTRSPRAPPSMPSGRPTPPTP